MEILFGGLIASSIRSTAGISCLLTTSREWDVGPAPSLCGLYGTMAKINPLAHPFGQSASGVSLQCGSHPNLPAATPDSRLRDMQSSIRGGVSGGISHFVITGRRAAM